MNKKAFTLIELLVVMVIVGILLLIMFPVMGRIREGARMAQCSNNLRQIGIAIQLYVDDHDFKFPGHYLKEWYEYLEPYIDDINIFKCPNLSRHNYESQDHFSYGYNVWGLGATPYLQPANYYDWVALVWVKAFAQKYDWDRPRDFNDVLDPYQCIMVADGMPYSSKSSSRSLHPFSYLKVYNATWKRHAKKGVNALFVDGHVKWYLTHPLSKSEIPNHHNPYTKEERLLWWNYNSCEWDYD
jgi:prepilin-type N-terminal cleavage/methylation domain-containing protein/prepilin-type processing-associated H-X9-DG protein